MPVRNFRIFAALIAALRLSRKGHAHDIFLAFATHLRPAMELELPGDSA